MFVEYSQTDNRKEFWVTESKNIGKIDIFSVNHLQFLHNLRNWTIEKLENIK